MLPDSYAFTNYTNLGKIGSSYIYTIFQDSKENTWFGTFGKGLSVLKNNEIKNYSESTGLKDKVVYSVAEDRKGNIWFSTHSAGVYKYDGIKFTNYGLLNGLSDVDITAVNPGSREICTSFIKRG